ncbi:cobyrinate a,c-diamide synthase [Methanoregula sp.]|uniref:cobyrinate a,c-diamide synthase n=1 Tax=Methanoregula sp. TaxID=2052170 RepID=UPI002D06D1FB|nr:cobyrinate a,c-diamide synthase [Methanoregula sp.]HVP96532.1 cobyrinate a,c-diamide synthase [Methanoregula sp.]
MKADIPRIVIAGTHSGCGKTTIASGLMAALVARGLEVQPFKTGPDFIDPSHHTLICGRTSRNLDSCMMGEAGVLRTFAGATTGADIAVIEGAMGMFDGTGGTDTASAAHVARILRAPVVLVVDAHAVSRSIHATIRGFRDFDPRVTVAGIIYNRIGSDRHRAMIAQEEIVPALGWVLRQQECEVKSRHLGLVMAHESPAMKAFGRVIRESCDLDRILAVAGTARPLPVPGSAAAKPQPSHRRAVIGVARDEAFCFYYQDNIDRLARAGAEILYFSPLADAAPEMDAAYLGGGYPELHAAALERSRCRTFLHERISRGMPVYAECGGLMYLCRSLKTDRSYAMADVLPARAEMTQKLQALGYVHGSFATGSGLWAGKLAVHGHEFHYSRVECDNDARFALRLGQGKGIRDGHDGLTEHAAIGAYTHAYFTDAFARRFVDAAAASLR